MTTEVGTHKTHSLFEPAIISQAMVDACRKLDPRHQIKNPVMFVVWVGSIVTTLLFVQAIVGTGEAPAGFIFSIALWLWFTVLFANFAEAMAEGRGKAQADSLRRARLELTAKKLGTVEPGREHHAVWNRQFERRDTFSVVPRISSRKGMWSSSRPMITFPPTARWSRAWRRSMKARSPAKARPSFGKAAAIGVRSQEARRCSLTGSSFASRPTRARVFWTG